MNRLKNIKQNTLTVIKRFPVVLLSLAIIGILLIMLSHNVNIDEDILIKVMMATIVFATNALIFKIAFERYEVINSLKYFIMLGIGAAFSVFLYFFALDFDYSWTMIRYMIILFSQLMAFVSVAFLKEDDNIEHFVNHMVGRLAITFILYLITAGGISGIIFALEELFNIDFFSEIYGDIFIVLGMTFAPMLWLFGLNYDAKPLQQKLYKVLLLYVLMPLLFIYTAVVYAYIAKIVFSGFVFPNSIIGNLVLWYSLVSMIVLFLARPYSDVGIGKFFKKYYPIISIPPIIIMFISIFMRIKQYSLTINRYFLVIGGIWITAMIVYFIVCLIKKKKLRNSVMPISLGLIALLMIIEPISANTITFNSQVSRLEKLISVSMDDEDQEQVQEVLHYLKYNYSYENADFLSEEQIAILEDAEIDYENPSSYTRYSDYEYVYNDNSFDTLDISGYSAYFAVHDSNYKSMNVNSVGVVIEEIDNNNYITIFKDSEEKIKFTITQLFIDKITEKGDLFGNDSDDFIVILDDKDADIKVKIILSNLTYTMDLDKLDDIKYYDAIILVD